VEGLGKTQGGGNKIFFKVKSKEARREAGPKRGSAQRPCKQEKEGGTQPPGGLNGMTGRERP